MRKWTLHCRACSMWKTALLNQWEVQQLCLDQCGLYLFVSTCPLETTSPPVSYPLTFSFLSFPPPSVFFHLPRTASVVLLSPFSVICVFNFFTGWFKAGRDRRAESGQGMEVMLISVCVCVCVCVRVRREGLVLCPATAMAPPLIRHTSLLYHPLQNTLVRSRTYHMWVFGTFGLKVQIVSTPLILTSQ